MSGRSRKGVEKACFQKFERTFNFFFDLVNGIDRNYTQTMLKKWFQNMMSNSERRSLIEPERASRVKKRSGIVASDDDASSAKRRKKKDTCESTANETTIGIDDTYVDGDFDDKTHSDSKLERNDHHDDESHTDSTLERKDIEIATSFDIATLNLPPFQQILLFDTAKVPDNILENETQQLQLTAIEHQKQGENSGASIADANDMNESSEAADETGDDEADAEDSNGALSDFGYSKEEIVSTVKLLFTLFSLYTDTNTVYRYMCLSFSRCRPVRISFRKQSMRWLSETTVKLTLR